MHAGMPYAPWMENPTPDGEPLPQGWRTPHLGLENPLVDGEPPRIENPPRWRTPRMENPSPGKQTPAYGLRAAGTHPTGMHSCIPIILSCKIKM